MVPKRGAKKAEGVNPTNEKKGEKGSGGNGSDQKIYCVCCGQWLTPANPEKLTLPKHKNPLNGKSPEKVGFCIGEGTRGKTKEELRRIRIKTALQQRREEKPIQL
jgi:hypothetical protein